MKSLWVASVIDELACNKPAEEELRCVKVNKVVDNNQFRFSFPILLTINIIIIFYFQLPLYLLPV